MAIGIIKNVGGDSFFPAGWKLRTGEIAANWQTFSTNYKQINGVWRQGGTFTFNNDIIPLAGRFNGSSDCVSSSYLSILAFNVLYNDLNNVAKTDMLLSAENSMTYRILVVNTTRIDLMFRYGMNFDLLQRMKKFEVYGGGGAGYADYGFAVTAWLERA